MNIVLVFAVPVNLMMPLNTLYANGTVNWFVIVAPPVVVHTPGAGAVNVTGVPEQITVGEAV